MPLPQFDPAQYDRQLADKVARYRADFAALAMPEPEVFASAPLGYRLRAEFRMWHVGDRVHYAMFDPAEPKRPVLIEAFAPAAAPIARVMTPLRERLDASDVLRRRLFQVEFLATLSGELMISLVYHRRLDADWETAARALAADLGAVVIGRSRGQKVVLERDWLIEAFELDGRMLRYRQIEGSFTQPNGGVNRHMLSWARRQAAGFGGDLLELYCGNGNFTVALAPLFDKVLATEMSKTSVGAAHVNLEANAVGNVAMVRMASEEISDALAGGRDYRRMRGIDLPDYRFTTLFVDPPRGGLDAATVALAGRFDNVLYISCNPETLRRDVGALAGSHRIAAAAAFDQFPYTHHLECGMWLTRRA
ncbi:tRNA (uridine(54)-C5)-methyltransferase TrmA [Nitrogeniibacter mangrovi]|uniref:tRNA/tmRNA (uracil-C(5))-methyltransferase n=1 Tax=Nitrogeniibacter mangrovi TaxID=2016596 RepID=A0A6C1B3X1_9RHOO|nr:tRNA (uridine(54)-C5)-methyltransferase TrmA [Nitrogeniibacter mangrovi]QID17548.1 tRNA (uridine(54)-C5)-methyltransferase TrmA [Nitrogeniibacter mangrovi]